MAPAGGWRQGRAERVGSMMEMERSVSQLFRPPLGLAVAGAALKYVATAAILADPLLSTRGDFLREREDATAWAQLRRLALLGARVAFIGLASSCFEQDWAVLSEGLQHFHGLQRCHLAAMILAFSPNAVAAVAAAGILEVKAAWLRGLPVHRGVCGSVADLAALAYVAFMTVVYTLPLAIVSVVYGVPGMFAIVWSFACEFVVRPWEMATQGKFDFGNFWIALPVLVAFVLGNCLIVVIVYSMVSILELRYPHIAQQVSRQKGKNGKSRLASDMPVHVIGCVRELVGSREDKVQDDKDVIGDTANAELDLLPAGNEEDVEDGAAKTLKSFSPWGEAANEDQCVINDSNLGAIWVFKVTCCIAIPMLQVCVVITAKVLLGQAGPWTATLEVFGERTWARYVERVSSSGCSGVLPLIWYYT